ALMTSANNTLTLIAQSTIQPFVKVGPDIKSNAINLHALPWPKEALQDLPSSTEVKLRITLSYFIEPSPGERGWDKKYGYASHGLRIEVQRPTEDVSEFALRINAHDRDAAYDTSSHHGETGEWFFRPDLHTNGSVMSNVWRGTAAELANRSHIAVYPAMGWWRTRPKENRYEKSVRYSLIVSIETPDITTDIYTPVAALVGIKQPVPVDIEV
ncbi:MAG: subtilase, partial [Hyphomicrobium sp.]